MKAIERLRDQWSKKHHSDERQARGNQRQHRQKLLVESKLVDLEPRRPCTRKRNGAEHEDYQRGSNQCPCLGARQLLNDLVDQHRDNHHRAGEHDFLP